MVDAALPEGMACYRRIGPFDATSLPAGLRAEHRLKPGVWAVLSVRSGALRFVWDDGRAHSVVDLAPGDTITVPPVILHHVESDSDFVIEIAFHR